MSDFSRLWIQEALNTNAINRAKDAIKNTGRALPCHVTAVNGSILTVEFDINTDAPLPPIALPKAESSWIRSPTQVGDKGFTVPADVYLGGVSGLGGGIADFSEPGNLSALVFVPVSNSNSPPVDQNAAQVQGPNGAIIQTSDGASKAVVSSTGTDITFGSASLNLSSSSSVSAFGSNNVIITSTGISITGITDITGDVNIVGNFSLTGTFTSSTGATGTFTSADSKTITVTSGLITSIV